MNGLARCVEPEFGGTVQCDKGRSGEITLVTYAKHIPWLGATIKQTDTEHFYFFFYHLSAI